MPIYKCINPTPDLVLNELYEGRIVILGIKEPRERLAIVNNKGLLVHYYAERFRLLSFENYNDML